jgi:hypothetical protein
MYYTLRQVSPHDLALMRRIDELHLEHPFCRGTDAAGFAARRAAPDRAQARRHAPTSPACSKRTASRSGEDFPLTAVGVRRRTTQTVCPFNKQLLI